MDLFLDMYIKTKFVEKLNLNLDFIDCKSLLYVDELPSLILLIHRIGKGVTFSQ